MAAGQISVVWRRRLASAAAVVNLAYVLITVFRTAHAVAVMVGWFSSTPSGVERMLKFFTVGGLVILLVIGLAIASPLLTWLAVLAVGLWRGRPWARIGGMVTFALVVVVLAVMAVRGGAEIGGYGLAVLFALPAVLGLVILLRGTSAFAEAVPGGAAPSEVADR